MAVPVDLDDTKQMTDIVRSTIGTKFSSRFGDQMVNLALTAVRKVVKGPMATSPVGIRVS